MKATFIYKGGKYSGNYGHVGIPGHRGGSARTIIIGQRLVSIPKKYMANIDPVNDHGESMYRKTFWLPDLEKYFEDHPDGSLVYANTEFGIHHPSDNIWKVMLVHRNTKIGANEEERAWRITHLYVSTGRPTGHESAQTLTKIQQLLSRYADNLLFLGTLKPL